MPPDDAFARAASYAELALRASPELSASHMCAAYLRTSRDFDWAGAEAEYRHALELSPNDAEACDLLGRLYAGIGRYDEALELLRRAQELDPLAHQNDIITTLLRAGRYEEAAERAATSVEINATNARTRATLAWAEFLRGRRREGLAEMEHAVELHRGARSGTASSARCTAWPATRSVRAPFCAISRSAPAPASCHRTIWRTSTPASESTTARSTCSSTRSRRARARPTDQGELPVHPAAHASAVGGVAGKDESGAVNGNNGNSK
jgi:hypothetical protein